MATVAIQNRLIIAMGSQTEIDIPKVAPFFITYQLPNIPANLHELLIFNFDRNTFLNRNIGK